MMVDTKSSFAVNIAAAADGAFCVELPVPRLTLIIFCVDGALI